MKCLICKEFETDSLKSFDNHLRYHKVHPKDYYDEYIKTETEGICCNCGNKTKYVNCFTGYKKYCSSTCVSQYRIGKKCKPKIKKTCIIGTIKCVYCDYSTNKIQAMISHYQHHHKDKIDDNKKISQFIYDTYYKKEIDGKCLYCGNQTSFSGLLSGYRRYCSISCTRIHELEQGIFKVRNNTWKYKKYIMPSGKEYNVQGFEPHCIDYLLSNGINENEIIICGKELPKIEYMYNDKIHRYFPDMYIKYLNLIIEVKGNWTYNADYDINQLKKESCEKLGYKFLFVIENDFDKLNKILNNGRK